MNYAKPVITLIDAAKSAIQGMPKATGAPDGGPQDHVITVAAYEADE